MDVIDGSVDMNQVHLPETWMSLMGQCWVLIWTKSTYLGHGCHWWECWYEPSPPTWDMDVIDGSVDMNQVHLPGTWMSLMGVLIWTKSTYLIDMNVTDGSVDMNQVHLPETWMSLMGVLIWTKSTYLGHGCHWWECWYEPSPPTWDMDVIDGSVDMNQVHLPGWHGCHWWECVWYEPEVLSTYLGHVDMSCHWWECWYEPSPPTWDMNVTDGSVDMNQVHLPGTWMSLMGVLIWSTYGTWMSLMGVLIWTKSTYLGHGCHWWECWYEPSPPTWDMNVTDGSVDMNQVHLPGTWMSLMGVLIWTKFTYLGHGCHWWECWYEPSPPTWDMDVIDGSVDMNQVHLPGTWMSLMKVLICPTKSTYLGHGHVTDGSVDMNQVHLPGTWMSLMGVLTWSRSTYLGHECHWCKCWYEPSPPTWDMVMSLIGPPVMLSTKSTYLDMTWMSLMIYSVDIEPGPPTWDIW